MTVSEMVSAIMEVVPNLSDQDASRLKALLTSALADQASAGYIKGADDMKATLGKDYEVFKVNIRSQVLEAAITTTSEVCERIALALESQSKPEGRDAAFECAKTIRDLPRS